MASKKIWSRYSKYTLGGIQNNAIVAQSSEQLTKIFNVPLLTVAENYNVVDVYKTKWQSTQPLVNELLR